MITSKDYDIRELGDRAKCIPGPEPELNTTIRHIPVSSPDLNPNAKHYVLDALSVNWISSRGDYLDDFEDLFAEKVGASFAVAVNSGTNALFLAVAALGIPKGSRVIVPTFTMASSAFAVSYLDLIPVFIDCDEYYQMDVTKLESLVKKHNAKLILPVHIYGHPVDCDPIEAIAAKYDIPVIYDACEAHGALYKGHPIGGKGTATCYSFYANKIITTGEGGMVVSNDKRFIDICRNLKDVAFSNERHFWHKRLGYNFRMTNICAAIGLSQVEKFDYYVKRHVKNAHRYTKGLRGIPGIRPAKTADYATNVHWMYGIEVSPGFGMSRDELRQYLADNGVETRTYFVPMHLQPYYADGNKKKVFPVSERLSEQGMYLPSSSALRPLQIDTVCELIKKANVSTRS